MNAVSVDGITVTYGDQAVLKDISLDIEEGEFAGIIGPNGSGKTTLIKAMLGLVEPKEGAVRIFDRSPEQARRARDIGYVPQQYPQERDFPATVRELLVSSGYAGETDEIIESLDLEDLMSQRFSDLSGGQQQRVMVAMALMNDPRLLVLDEPSVGVDVDTQHRFYSFLQKINEEHGVTILLVSHDTSMLSEFSNSVVCINRTVCGHGSPDDIDRFLDEVYGKQFHHVHDAHPDQRSGGHDAIDDAHDGRGEDA